MMKNEPVASVAAITAVVSALLALGVAFGLSLTQEQTAAIMGIVAVLGPLVAAVVQRSQVTPVVASVLPADDVYSETATSGTEGAEDVVGEVGDTGSSTGPQIRYRGEPGPESINFSGGEQVTPRRGRDDDGDGTPDTA